MKRSNFAAWMLIILGSVLLLNQLDVFYATRVNILIIGSLFLGALLFKKGLYHPDHKGILGGSFFILLAATLILMRFSFFPIRDSVGVGIILVNLGISNIIYFFFSRSYYSNLITGFIFIIIGAPFLVMYYYYVPGWVIRDLFFTYWPVILIMIGSGLLIEAFFKKSKTSDTKDLSQPAS